MQVRSNLRLTLKVQQTNFRSPSLHVQQSPCSDPLMHCFSDIQGTITWCQHSRPEFVMPFHLSQSCVCMCVCVCMCFKIILKFSPFRFSNFYYDYSLVSYFIFDISNGLFYSIIPSNSFYLYIWKLWISIHQFHISANILNSCITYNSISIGFSWNFLACSYVI